MGHADHFQIVRLIAATVGNHQFAIRFARGVDHRQTIGWRVRHGFFRQHMLASLVPPNRIFGVHAIGENDVDDVDFGVVANIVVVLIVVNVLRVDSVLQCKSVCFVGMAANQSNHFGFLALGKCGQDLVDGERAETDNGPPHFLARGDGRIQGKTPSKQCFGNISRNHTGPGLNQEPPACDPLAVRIRHGHILHTDIVRVEKGKDGIRLRRC